MTRNELIQELDDISEMSDHEVAINAAFIRRIAYEAISHIKSFDHVKTENRKMKTTITNLNSRIENLEKNGWVEVL